MLKVLNNKINELGMLNHHFYKVLWNEGKLSKDDLKYYAQQYYYIERNFLSCLMQVKSLYNLKQNFKSIIEENIADESGNAGKKQSHLELWLKFCEFLGTNESEVLNVEINQYTKSVIEEANALIKKSFASAVGLFYAYEFQIPQIAESKIQGIIKHYNSKENGAELEFFYEHKVADKWHTAQWQKIIITFSEVEMLEFKTAVEIGAKSLLHFLDGVMDVRKIECLD